MVLCNFDSLLSGGNATINIVVTPVGAVFTPPASMTITATASDSDGSVSGVSFYSNGNFVGNGAFTAPD